MTGLWSLRQRYVVAAHLSHNITTNCTTEYSSPCRYSVQNSGPVLNPTSAFSVAIPDNPLVYNANTSVHNLNLIKFSSFQSSQFCPGGDYNECSITASECALWFCVQSYSTTMQDGAMNQLMTRSWPQIGDDTTASIKSSPLRAESTGLDWVNITDLPPEFQSPPGVNYGIETGIIQSLSIDLHKKTNNESNKNVIRVSDVKNGQHGQHGASDFASSMFSASLHEGLDHWISRIAQSMTNSIRIHYPASTIQHPPTAATPAKCMR